MKLPNKIYLSVVIPTYNEQDRLGITLEAMTSYLSSKPYTYELLLVDDGSRDKTIEVASEIISHHSLVNFRIIKNVSNHGKGYVVKQGMLAAKGQIILFSDADLATPIEVLDAMLPLIETKYDVVFASRALDRTLITEHQPKFRELSGKIINKIVQLLYLPRVQDSQCGFKLFKRKVAQTIFSRQVLTGWLFDVEILWLAKKFGFSLFEYPVPWRHVPDSRVKMNLGSILSLMKDIIKLRFLH
jgi:dolichyl-phosphate beta-glucosyltransferase